MDRTRKILIILALIITTNANAYDFAYRGNSGSIDDLLKKRIDRLIELKMDDPQIKLRYFNALKRYDLKRLAPGRIGVYNYLMMKLDPDKTQINISTGSTNPPQQNIGFSENQQEPINTPLVAADQISESFPRKISNIYSTENEKSYVETLRRSVREYVELNDEYEYIEYAKTFRVNLKEFYSIDTKNPLKAYAQIPTLGKELLYKKGGKYYITSGGYSIEQKQALKDIIAKTKLAVASEDAVVFASRGGYYHAYTFYDYKYYTIPAGGIYLSQYSGIDSLGDMILIKKGSEYMIVAKYGEYKLFPVSYLSKIRNPLEVLTAAGRDIYFYKGNDIESTMKDIKTKTEEITAGMTTDSQKISALYSWITSNLRYDEYSKDFVQGDLNEKTYLANVDNNVFTGLGSFKSKNSVCDGYTKLYLYMLGFAGVEGISIETGQGDIGAAKTIAHAWNRIGDKLYDATWDTYSLGDPAKFRWFALSEQEMYKTHFRED